MNDSQGTKRPRGTRWCSTGIVFSVGGLLLIIIGLLGVRIGLFGPLGAFGAFGIGGLALIISIVSTGAGLMLSKGTAGTVPANRAWSALGIAILVIALSLFLRPDASGAPAIHDISTDVGNPPFFEAILPLRADAPNPPEYSGEETAELQQAAFPDIQTLTVEKPAAEVFDAAEQTARDMGWEVVAADPDTGRIEATDTTFWFRFKDDVVIRLTPRGYGTYVDIRSKSRIGRGDMGTNARRVRAFLARLGEAAAS